MQSINFEPINLSQLLEKIVGEFKLEFDTEKVKLICAIEDDQIHIKGDRTGLRQVVINLLLNGLEATADNKADRTVSIALKKKAEVVSVTVSDNGPGIKRSNRDKLFEPFYTTKVKGSGLGLYMCRKIVTMHNGTIDVVRSEDSLTRFEICLPVGD